MPAVARPLSLTLLPMLMLLMLLVFAVPRVAALRPHPDFEVVTLFLTVGRPPATLRLNVTMTCRHRDISRAVRRAYGAPPPLK